MLTGKLKEKLDIQTTAKDEGVWAELEKLIFPNPDEHCPNRQPFVRDIFKAAIQLARESPGTLNLKMAATTLKELRYSFKIFYPHRYIPKITMFGSARVSRDSPLYKLALLFSSIATEKGYMIMTGGGPGIMAAGNEGAKAKSGFGLNIRLPHEQHPNPYIDAQKSLIYYKYFFTRKLFLVKEASAFAFFPGGFGTFDEAFEVLTLVQSGKSSLIPIVMLEPKGFGYWKSLVHFLERSLLKNGFISPGDTGLFRIFHDPAKAFDHISMFYKNYHSMRFVKEKLVFRVKKTLSRDVLDQMNLKFGSILQGGKFEISRPLREEKNEPEVSELPRLVFEFDRKSYSVLRSLIDFINQSAV